MDTKGESLARNDDRFQLLAAELTFQSNFDDALSRFFPFVGRGVND
jgi:hypothetical protein